MKTRLLYFAICGIIMILSLFWGIAVNKFQIFPYKLLIPTYNSIGNLAFKYQYKKQKLPSEIPNEYYETDVKKLISITQQQDVNRLRKELLTLLWGKDQLPSAYPSIIDTSTSDHRYGDISSLSSIDKLSMIMEFGLESYAYHFIPKAPNNKIILYHQGHNGDFIEGKHQIRQFLDNGYSVVAFSMPLLGLNNKPTIQIPKIGNLKLTRHDQMKFLSPNNGHPIKYFIEPVVIVLNYLEDKYDYSSVAMVGISGGGWTTTLAAAIDTRIKNSFPVAGSYPIYLRSNSYRDWGDYEQTTPEIYKKINYLELYILGSYGSGRKQLQVINMFDSCCFAGVKWETYYAIVREQVQELGAGEFELFLDTTHSDHVISENTMTRILDEL